MTAALARLPDDALIAKAVLPGGYENAKIALAECARIDECLKWADKMAAMASYAKQAGDKTLGQLATKIRSRAIRRCSKLYAEIKKAKPPGKKINLGAQKKLSPREQARTSAGISTNQRATIVAVGALSDEEFESAVEAEEPATVTQLAKMGTKKRAPVDSNGNEIDLEGTSPADFRAATTMQGALRSFVEHAKLHRPEQAWKGTLKPERKAMGRNLAIVLDWAHALEQVMTENQ